MIDSGEIERARERLRKRRELLDEVVALVDSAGSMPPTPLLGEAVAARIRAALEGMDVDPLVRDIARKTQAATSRGTNITFACKPLIAALKSEVNIAVLAVRTSRWRVR